MNENKAIMTHKIIYCKIVTILFLSISFISSLFSQTDELNLQKYWYYRLRLINNFLKIGNCQGCSVPSSIRAADNHLHWGDATTDLGWYIGVLATEYKLLKDNNQPTDSTVKELYFALDALNRLDNNIESYWRCPLCPVSPQSGDLNGFFMRDDVPESIDNLTPNFIGDPTNPNAPGTNYSHFNNLSLLPSTKFTVQNVVSGFHHNTGTGDPPTEESHDQVWHLLIGLALTAQYVHPQTYNNQPFLDCTPTLCETDIGSEALLITDRIISWLQDHCWRVHNPVTQRCVHTAPNCNINPNRKCTCADWFIPDAVCGSDATALSYGAANAAKFITGLNYGDAISSGVGFIEWLGYLGAFFACKEADKFQTLDAIGNISSVLLLGTQAAACHYEHLPLLMQILHGTGNLIQKSNYETLLDVAPCAGPFNLGNGNYESFQWSSPHRFKAPENRGFNPCDVNCQFRGEYNGLDYMLLYNLYSIAQSDRVAPYINLKDRIISINFPGTVIPVGSKAFPIQISAFNTITATNHIKSGGTVLTDGDVTYRAGREIAMLPGFGVDAGAEFGAFIDPFKCSSTGTYVRTSGDTSKQVASYNLPTHFVYYANASNAPAKNDFHQENFLNIQDKITEVFFPAFYIIPNPSSGLFTLVCDKQVSNIVIQDMIGKVVFTHTENNMSVNIDINLSSHPKGIYFVKVITSNGQSFVEKVVIQ